RAEVERLGGRSRMRIVCCLPGLGRGFRLECRRFECRTFYALGLARLATLWRLAEAVARATDREALLVQQFSDAANPKHFVVLIVATVAAPLHRPQLR